ncbi:MAG: Uma2 family endonuclease [Acidobacteriota bacterium]|nr:Uma2 family endonuclease [Acidobacteriota bacterium]
MIAATLVPVEEYIASSYTPDVDYEEGRLVEKNAGKWKHARLQILIGSHIVAHESGWRITGLTDQRIRVAPNRFFIPDVCAVMDTQPYQDLLEYPPLFTIEVLSEGDSFSDSEKKAHQYLELGVPCVWTVDPETGGCYRHTSGAILTVSDGVVCVEGSPIAIPIPELLSQLRPAPRP